MPRYATSWTDPQNPELVVFQIQLKRDAGRFYFRVKIDGQARVEGLLASQFGYSDVHKQELEKEYSFAQVRQYGPPDVIIGYARRVLFDLRKRAGKGERLKSARVPTIAKMYDDWVSHLENLADSGLVKGERLAHAKSFRRYIAEYEPWGKTPVDEVTADSLAAWQSWRDIYWSLGPGKDVEEIEYERAGKRLKRPIGPRTPPRMSTKGNEWALFKAALEHAAGLGHLKRTAIPVHRFRRGAVLHTPPKKTPHFTMEQWKVLEEAAKGWLNPDKLMGDNRIVRQLCWWYVLLCRAYALRAAEANLLTFASIIEDIDDDGPVVHLDIPAVKAKVRPRRAEPIHGFREQVRRVLVEELPAFYEKNYAIRPEPADPLWMFRDRTRIKSMEGSFASLLKAAGLEQDALGNAFTFTSLRHSAITQEILETDLSPLNLATWAGTSVLMIEKTYNHAISARARRQERQRRERLMAARAATAPGNRD